MDLYLPADFRELHAAARDDWRDASSCGAHRAEPDAPAAARQPGPQRDDDCVDPLWRAI